MSSLLGDWFFDLEINRSIYGRDNHEKEKFGQMDDFAHRMRKKLNSRSWYTKVAYTPHDFDHHIKSVLINASKLLAPQLDLFSIEELLALQYASILHDIDMVYNPFQREIHSYNGAIILSPYKEYITDIIIAKAEEINKIILDLKGAGAVQSSNAMQTINNIHEFLRNSISFDIPDRYMQEAISYIILGHSDIKLDGDFRVNTLDCGFFKDIMIPYGLSQEPIKLRILAAILRFADELDCSKSRVVDISADKNPLPVEANKYWDKLEIISSVSINNGGITLKIDKEIIRFGNDPYVFGLLLSVEDKIDQERRLVNQCFNDEKYPLHFNELKLDWGALQKDGYEGRYNSYKEEERRRSKEKADRDKKAYNISKLREEINHIIDEKELFRDVHRRVSGKCIRTYLDCNGLLTKHRILDCISQVFLNALTTGSFEKMPNMLNLDQYVLVGVANSGVLISANMSYISGIPMLYYVPPYKERKFTRQEMKELEIYSSVLINKKVALVIGVNHTGTAIKAAYEYIMHIEENQKINTEVCCVLGVVNRDNDCEILRELSRKSIPTHFIIENKYPIEWCHYENNPLQCPHSQKCKSGEEE